MEANNYSSDAPVNTKREDRFSRWIFAERISQVISKRSDPSSIVIGLYGAWGDGKTSVLNFIEEALNDDANVICIKFNPWRFGSEEELLTGFFMNIAEALDAQLIKTGDKFKDMLKKMLPGVGAAAGMKGTGDSIASFISGPDIVELKKRIEEELDEAKKRVLILIDDVDRLEKLEIHAIFRLVKLTADFKYTSYILAFDKDVVAASLQEKYSSSSKNAGEAFLEKIIQVPLHLPFVEKKVLREFCFQGVDEALSIAEIELSDQQTQEFVRDFINAFDDCLITPRKARLYGNTLMFSLPILRGEINPVDLMLVEGLRIFYPNLYEAIRDNKSYFTGSFSISLHSHQIDREKERIVDLIDTSIDSGNNVDKEGCIKLLKNMFPKLQAVYGNTNYGSDWYKEWDLGQRICSENYFSRYFSYSIPKGDISDQAILELVAACKNGAEAFEKDKNPLANMITDANSETLIKKLRRKASTLTADESSSLALAVSLQCDIYPNPETLFDYSSFMQAAILVNDLFQNLDVNNRVELACDCINRTSCTDFKLEVFRWLKREEEDKPEKVAFTEEQISLIGNCLGGNITKYLNSGIDITIANPKSTPALLYATKKYLRQGYVDQYLHVLFKKEPATILRLLDLYTPTAWGMESGVSHKSDFKREQYDSLTAVVSPDILMAAIESFCGTMPVVGDEFPRDDDCEDRAIILKQFIWLHKYVLNETEKI